MNFYRITRSRSKAEQKQNTDIDADIGVFGEGISDPIGIYVKNLNVSYGGRAALKNINFEMQKNTVTAFIGPSGCGKSTLLKTFNRMNDLVEGCVTDGKVLINGKDIYNDIDVTDLRKNVGMVFQKPNPFAMSIYENVAYGPRIYGIKKKDVLDEFVENALKQAAIFDEVKDQLSKSAFGLSGGQQQRLCIARSLAVRPKILLMDEPTSARDPLSTAKIEELIDGLREHLTIIIVTHNMQQAARISSETAFFLSGELIEFDDTDYIFSRPKDKRTENYISGRFG
jgi:phosphate transport system ATP-binding protein